LAKPLSPSLHLQTSSILAPFSSVWCLSLHFIPLQLHSFHQPRTWIASPSLIDKTIRAYDNFTKEEEDIEDCFEEFRDACSKPKEKLKVEDN